MTIHTNINKKVTLSICLLVAISQLKQKKKILMESGKGKALMLGKITCHF